MANSIEDEENEEKGIRYEEALREGCKTKSLGERTGVDFGQHELMITKTGDLLIHDFKKLEAGLAKAKE